MNQEIRPRQSESPQGLTPVDSSTEQADLGTEMVEGRVAEVAQTSAGESQPSGGGQTQAQDDSAQQDDALVDDRSAMKARLLQNAPKANAMRSEVKDVLLKEKSKLESDISTYRRKKNYHMLSLAIMRLREVVRQLEDLAKASADALKEMWLKVVHKFA